MRWRFVSGLLLLLANCSSTAEPPEELLLGSWSWVRSVGGIAGETRTPTSEGYPVTFTFLNRVVHTIRNDSVKDLSQVEIAGDNLSYSPALGVFLFDSQIAQSRLRRLAGDSIALADPCCDRYDHIFVRIQEEPD